MSGVYASYPANGGGGGVTTLGPVGAAPNANGGLISGTTLTLEPANTSFPGVLTAADWNTFNNKQATITIGALDAQAANATGLALVANVLSTQSADASHPGVVNTTTQTFAGNKTLSGTTTTAAIIPSITATYGFGTALATWFNGYINSLFTSRVQSTGTDDLTIATNAGNIYLAPSSTKHALYQDGSQGTAGQALISSDVNGTLGFAALNLATAGTVTGILPNANTTAASANTASTIVARDGSGNFTAGTITAALTGNATTVTTNANLTGDVTSVGNTTTTVRAPAGTLTGTTLNSTVVTSSLTSVGVQAQALDMGTHLINNVVDPTTAQQAATKNYVDTVASQLQPIQAVTAASTANIPGTYVQVGGGLGDTFTITSTAAFTIDGITPTATQRVLLKDQTTGQQNGVYNVTTVANVGVLGAILTRAVDYSSVADVNAGDLVPVISGTVNTKTSWLQTATVTSVGSAGTPMTFVQWTANPSSYLLKANNLSDVTTPATAFNNISPMSAGGDLIYGGASGVGTRLANGSANQTLLSAGGTAAPTWGTLTPAGGGTGQTTIQAALAALSTWTTAVSYAVGQQVTYGTNVYICVVAHTSGASIAVDIALGKWTLGTPLSQPSANLMLTGTGFEDNTVGGWIATGTPTVTNGLPISVGSGGNVFSTSNGGQAKGANTTAAAVTSSSPIDGIYSLNLATSGAGTIGDGYISQSIPISTAYQAKVLTLKFKYKSASGAPVMGGTSANTYAAAMYDVTNNAWLPFVGNFNFVQSSGVGEFIGTVQTASTTAAVQVFIYSPVAPVGASSLLLDNFYLGQQTASLGPAMTDEVSFTPTGTWTANTTYTGSWSRIGDKAKIRYSWSLAGAPTATGLALNMPPGLTIDSTKFPGGLNQNGSTLFQTGYMLRSGTQSVHIEGRPASSSTITVFYVNSTGSGNFIVGESAQINATTPYTWGAGDIGTLEFIVPITGWSSNTNMSNDTDTRVVAMNGIVQTPTGTLNGSFNVTKFGTVTSDTHAGYSTSTGLYTVPVTGYYHIHGVVEITASYTAGQHSDIKIFKNGTGGTGVSIASFVAVGTVTGGIQPITYDGLVYCSAGDTLGVYAESSGASISYTANVTGSTIFIERLSGPAVIAATESVNMKYANTAGTSIANSGDINVPFATKSYDSHNAYGGTQYTVPVSGKYRISGTVTFANSLYAIGNSIAVSVYKNTAIESYGPVVTANAAVAVQAGGLVTTTVSCVAGDLLEIKVTNTRTAGATLLATTAGLNHIEIERVGN